MAKQAFEVTVKLEVEETGRTEEEALHLVKELLYAANAALEMSGKGLAEDGITATVWSAKEVMA